MSPRSKFFWSRTRAGSRVLLALAVITAIAALLLGAIIGAVRADESAGVLRGIEAAPGDRGQLTVSLNNGEASGQEPNIQRALDKVGVGGAMTVSFVGENVYEIAPDPARFTADDATVLAQQTVPTLGRAISDATDTTARVSGGLLVTLGDVTAGVETRRGPTAMAIGIVALLAGVVVGAASVEPVRQRLAERALLRARGMSKWGLMRLALGEAVPVLALSAGVGVALATLLVRLTTGTVMPLWIPLAVAIGLTIIGALTVTIATVRGVDRRSSRADAFAGIAAVVVLGVLTAVAGWQFLRARSAVVVRSDGTVTVDPLVVMAPALGLVLFALVAVVLARPIASAIAWPLSKSKGLTWLLPLRLAARRTSRHALTTGVVAFAVATITLATVYQASLTSLGTMPEQLRVGTDVRVSQVTEASVREQLRELPGVAAAMPARELAIRDTSGNYPLLVVQAETMADTMTDAEGALDLPKLSEELRAPAFGLPITAPELQVSLEIPLGADLPVSERWGAGVPGVDVALTIVDAAGTAQRYSVNNVDVVEMSSEEGGTWQELHFQAARTQSVTLEGTGPWRLISLEAGQHEFPFFRDVTLNVTIEADGSALDLSTLTGSTFEPSGAGLNFDLNQPTNIARPADAPSRYPIVITRALANALDVQPGSKLSLAIDNSLVKLDTEVVDIVPLIPGIAGGRGAMIDAGAFALSTQDAPQINELWLATDGTMSATDVAQAAAAVAPNLHADSFDENVIADASETAFVFTLAAAGSAALALVVLILRRSRAGDETDRELGTLAVLGLGRTGAARARAKEDVFAIVLGVLGGVAGGLAIAWLIVPSLLRGVYPRLPRSYPVELVVPWLHLLFAVLAVTAVFALVAASVRAPRSLANVLREAE